jgi:hypothetical protein
VFVNDLGPADASPCGGTSVAMPVEMLRSKILAFALLVVCAPLVACTGETAPAQQDRVDGDEQTDEAASDGEDAEPQDETALNETVAPDRYRPSRCTTRC